nr:helix-turn-helix domain-containing protein [uncultured Rhodoferax sp.]
MQTTFPYVSSAHSALPVAPKAWHYCAFSEDVDEHAGSQREFLLSYDQITPGTFQGQIQMLQLPGVLLVHERTNCGTRQRGRLADGCYGFASLYEMGQTTTFHGMPVHSDAIMMGRGHELDLCSVGGMGLTAVVVDADLLRTVWQEIYRRPWNSWFDYPTVSCVNATKLQGLHALQRHILQRGVSTPGVLVDPDAMTRLRDELLYQWMETLPEEPDVSDLQTVSRRKKLVDRACEVALAQREHPPSMLALCRQVGASQRKLEYCFKDIVGMTPAQFLRTLRLNAARRAIKAAGQEHGIQGIAAQWGFLSASDFSSDFKRQFGELPSGARLRAVSRALLH